MSSSLTTTEVNSPGEIPTQNDNDKMTRVDNEVAKEEPSSDQPPAKTDKDPEDPKLDPAENANEKTEKQEDKSKKPRIGYRVEYRDRWSDALVEERVVEPHYEPEYDHFDGPIFEIITSYKVSNIQQSETPVKNRSGTLPTRRMHIYSIALINALQSVVQYYPDQDFSGEYIKIPSPYPVLVHHYDELKDFRKYCMETPEEELCVREKDAAEHIRVLLDFLDVEVMADVREEQERNKRGYSTYAWKWVSYKPGVTVLTKTRDNSSRGDWEASVTHSVRGGVFENPPRDWDVKRWHVAFNGRHLERMWRPMTTWYKFDGERNDEEEQRFYDPDDNDDYLEDEAANALIENGRRFEKMLEAQCYHHSGKGVLFPHRESDGLVMVDLETSRTPGPSVGKDDLRNWITDCTCDVCEKDSADKDIVPLFSEFGDKAAGCNLNDFECLLCPTTLPVYFFKTRVWETVHIRNLSEPKFEENMIKHLVMSPERLRTLMALSKSFVRVNKKEESLTAARWGADFVRGKGNGLVFLLHGKPGVGKTCTAECIAEFTKRPLMILTCSDIGTDPKEIENNLTLNFKRAMRWNAVLLIDEADIFMERRTTSDLTRNSLVAGFLRALEFYDGILFLTTNRVGSFDDAFISRIHVQLYYPEFTEDERQQVWQTFIDKLAREKGDTLRLTIDAKEYIQSTRKIGIKWNGREIRNAFQTAVALAEYDSEKDSEGKIKVTDNHLRAVVELSKDFKKYLDDLHKGDEAKRAAARRERLDTFSEEK